MWNSILPDIHNSSCSFVQMSHENNPFSKPGAQKADDPVNLDRNSCFCEKQIVYVCHIYTCQ